MRLVALIRFIFITMLFANGINSQEDNLYSMSSNSVQIDTIKHTDHESKTSSGLIGWEQKLYSLFVSELPETDSLFQSTSQISLQLSSDTLRTRLEALNAKTPFEIAYSPALESVIKRHLNNRKNYFEKLRERSRYYFPLFEEILDRYNLPLELKYLAVVESALNPRAKSRVGATGLWQFMFQTGKQYGLNVSSYVDERYDPELSTDAAARYLKTLYNRFEDWSLALAAYNSGPTNVVKAIRRSGNYTNYWNIRPYLPSETANYVPTFIATMYMFEYANHHGFKDPKPEIPIALTDTVSVKQLLTFDQISEQLNISKAKLQVLNPAYRLEIIPSNMKSPYSLRLPLKEMDEFIRNQDSIYSYANQTLAKREQPLPEYYEIDSKIRYRVKPGDYLGKIAKLYRVRVRKIKQWNGLKTDALRVGQRLIIYTRDPTVALKPSTAITSPNTKNYLVQKGDSLWSISKKLSGVSVQNLKDWNGISGSNLKPGMTLIISN